MLKNPFKNTSITELSHNRQGPKSDICSLAEDVLYDIVGKTIKGVHEDLVVCTLKIQSLNINKTFKKEYKETKDGIEYTCVLELFHEPEPCMYPHCVFRVWINGIKITYKNYKDTISKLTIIRGNLKEELASMVITKEINQV